MNSKSHLYIFCPKKSSKTSNIYKIESLTFLRFKFLPLLGQSTSYSHALCHTVQRHIVLRRAQSVGMPRHALRRRMPNTAGLRPRSLARWRGCLMPLKKSRARVGSCASSRSETSIFRSNTFGSYLFIEPYDLNQFLHVALESGYKNFFLLTV